MKKLLVVKLAVAALLALGSFSVAQDAATPTPEVQQSVSDAEAVAPVEPVADDGVAVVGSSTSDCIGCGQAAPMVSGCNSCNRRVASMRTRRCNRCATPCATPCDNGCASVCNTKRTRFLARRKATTCCGCNDVMSVEPQVAGCCGQVAAAPQVAQVTYLEAVQESESVVEAPVAEAVPAAEAVVATPMQDCNCCKRVGRVRGSAGCSSCAPVDPCNSCNTRTRGRLRGRVLRNR
ncbi:MAG: hypothetical protein P8J27_04925 [Mariniblastus sp.]|nr:hypothetical protein [Mariniblastus sp.]